MKGGIFKRAIASCCQHVATPVLSSSGLGIFRAFCSTSIARARRANYFDMFGLSMEYSVDEKKLERKFKALQREFHPDNFHNSDEKDKIEIEDVSAEINIAYTTLRDARLRAIYLLELRDIDVDSEGRTDNNAALLMEVMEAREAIEEAGSQEELKQLRQANRSRIEEWTAQIETGFKEGNMEIVRQAIDHLQYYNKIEEEIAERIEI